MLYDGKAHFKIKFVHNTHDGDVVLEEKRFSLEEILHGKQLPWMSRIQQCNKSLDTYYKMAIVFE